MQLDIKLQPWIIDTLNHYKFKHLTEIQSKTLNDQLNGKNIIGISSTGSGKTLAFLIPNLNKIEGNNDIQLLIISPTRELATQIYKVVNDFCVFNKQLRVQLIANENVQTTINKINIKKPQVIVSTPTKLKQIAASNQINFHNLKSIVIDEVDMLMDLDFWKEIDYFFTIYDHEDLQKSAWSATLHEQLSFKLKKFFKNTKIIQIGKSIYKNEKIKHHLIQTNDRFLTLSTLLKTNNFYLCLIFANTKKEVDEIYQFLLNNKYKAIKLHGDLNKRERAKNYREIKNLKYQYIVASDLASRGMDIEGASSVISWNIPNNLEWYIHRSGRCGRGKYSGDSYIIFDGKNVEEIKKLEAKNIEFNYLVQKKDKIIPLVDKKIIYKNEYNYQKINLEVSKLDNKQNKKVKPNYKKKQKLKIQDIKKQNKIKNKYQRHFKGNK